MDKCCVCSHCITLGPGVEHSWRGDINTPCPGVYNARTIVKKRFHQLATNWWCFYRMILYNQRNNNCQISGVAYYHYWDFPELAVPWNEKLGIIGTTEIAEHKLARPELLDPTEDPESEGLVGCPIHARCWEFLCRHKIGKYAKTQLKDILDVLHQKYRSTIKFPDEAWGGCVYWPAAMQCQDPGYISQVRSLIRKARKQGDKRFSVGGSINDRNCKLLHLPVEIIYLVLGYLPSTDVMEVQKLIGSYLGDAYWRSRIPMDFFHEVKEISGEALDWEFLCVSLDELRRHSQGLACRQFIIKLLDERLSCLTSYIENGNGIENPLPLGCSE